MDAGVVGALIGFSIIVAGCIGTRVYDMYNKKRKHRNEYTPVQSTPLLIRPPIHWKMKDLLKNQNQNKQFKSITGSRFLLTSSIDSQVKL